MAFFCVNEDLSFPLIRDSMFFSLWETGFRSFLIIKYAIGKPKTFAEMRSYIFFLTLAPVTLVNYTNSPIRQAR